MDLTRRLLALLLLASLTAASWVQALPPAIFEPPLEVRGQLVGELRLWTIPATGAFVAFKAPTPLGSSVTWILPNADGSSGQGLKTDGAGTLGWGAFGLAGTCVNSFVRALSVTVTPTCAQVDLTLDVTGLLPDANLAIAYSGVGACPRGQAVTTLTRATAPTCAAIPLATVIPTPGALLLGASTFPPGRWTTLAPPPFGDGALLMLQASVPTWKLRGVPGQRLVMVGNFPTWVSVPGVVLLPLNGADLPDASGSDNAPPTPVKYVSTGTQTTNAPKVTQTLWDFADATRTTILYTFILPADYASGALIRLKWRATANTSGVVTWACGQASTVERSTDDRALVSDAVVTVNSTAPGTLGQVVEATVGLTGTNLSASRKATLWCGRDGSNAGDTFTDTARLLALSFEYVRSN
jgi:hypothetical protein